MSDQPVVVRKMLPASREEGFDAWLDSQGMRDWMCPGSAASAGVTLEPRVGGRWYERGIDGSECDWGSVLDYDRPNHVAVSWRLNGEFQYDPDPAHQSRVDVWFTSEGEGVTRVQLVHSQLDRHGETWKALRDGVSSDGGWGSLLGMFATAAASPT